MRSRTAVANLLESAYPSDLLHVIVCLDAGVQPAQRATLHALGRPAGHGARR